ncbi:MAG: TetR/AcrR family transcriptional regulator [Pseudomonadota bacterium]
MAQHPTTEANRHKTSRGRPSMSPEKRDAMRRRIAEAARSLFETNGYATVSMRRIAKEVGCTPMALYSYYDAKIDILRTLWTGVLDSVFYGIERVPKDRDPTEYFAEISCQYVAYWLQNPDHYRLVFMAEGVTQPHVNTFLDEQDSAARYAVFAKGLADASPTPLRDDGLK